MAINSISTIASTPVCGLGTQTYNVTAAGLYTVEFKAWPPYLAAGGPAVTAQPIRNVQTITAVADSSGSLNSKWFKFYSAGALQGFYVWYNINSAGVDPAPAGLTGIQVTGATNATASTLGTATRAAIAANAAAASYVTVSGSTSAVILTDIQPGTTTAASDGTAPTGFSFATGTAGTYGTPAISGLNVVISQNSTVLARYGFPTPTQPIMGGSVSVQSALNDVLTVVFSSQSTADAAPNAVKAIVNVYLGG